MPRSDLRALIDKGRRAGLRTSELYQALASRRQVSPDGSLRDGNGFTVGFDADGHLVYQPADAARRG
jgi:hypothetical protein